MILKDNGTLSPIATLSNNEILDALRACLEPTDDIKVLLEHRPIPLLAEILHRIHVTGAFICTN